MKPKLGLKLPKFWSKIIKYLKPNKYLHLGYFSVKPTRRNWLKGTLFLESEVWCGGEGGKLGLRPSMHVAVCLVKTIN